QVSEAFLPEELGTQTGMALFSDTGSTNRQLNHQPNGCEKCVLERIEKRPLCPQFEILEAVSAGPFDGRDVVPRGGDAQTEPRHVILVAIQHLFEFKTNRII